MGTPVRKPRRCCLFPLYWPTGWPAVTTARKSGMVRGLRPDGKAQVTVEYDEDGRPLRLDTVVLLSLIHI